MNLSEKQQEVRRVTLYESVVTVDPVGELETPHDFVEYRSMIKTDGFNKNPLYKQDEIRRDFCATPKIKKYLDDKWDIEVRNRSNLQWIEELLKEEHNQHRIRKLKERRELFRSVIRKYKYPFKSLMFDIRSWS